MDGEPAKGYLPITALYPKLNHQGTAYTISWESQPKALYEELVAKGYTHATVAVRNPAGTYTGSNLVALAGDGGGAGRQCLPEGTFVSFDGEPNAGADGNPETEILLDWNYLLTDSDGDGAPDCPHDGFHIYRGGEQVGDVGSTVAEYLDRGLLAGTSYVYTLYAYNEDGQADNYASVEVATHAENEAPIATDTEEGWTQGQDAYTGSFVASDPDGDVLTYYVADAYVKDTDTGNVWGSVSYDTASPTFTITVTDATWYGSSYIDFTVSDPHNEHDDGRVTISMAEAVNEHPVASSSSETVNEDGSLDATAVASDPENGSLIYHVVSQPQNGSLANGIDGTGNYTYDPSAEWHGTDYFTFRVEDPEGNISNVAQVTITVVSVNDAPEITITGDNPYDVMFTDPGTYVDPGALWSDVEDGSGLTAVSGDIVNLANSGNYYIKYDYTDTDGAPADQETRTVRVNLGAVHDLAVSQNEGAPSQALDLNWSEPHTPTAGDPGYIAEANIIFKIYCQQSQSEEPIAIATTSPFIDTGDWLDGGLQPDTEYTYWITRHDTNGYYLQAQDGNTASGRTASQSTTPSPWYLSVLDGIPEPWHQCRLEWSPTVEETDITEFNLYQKKAEDTSWDLVYTVDVSDGIFPDDLNHLLSDLDPDTQYQFYVTAANSAGESVPSNTAEFTTSLVPTGVLTADTDEVGESAVVTVTGVIPNGWGYTTEDPGDETDVTQWPNVTLVTNGSMSDTAAYPAGSHEVWVAGIGYSDPTHHIQFETYSGISPDVTPEAAIAQDNVTLSCSVPHSGSNDWTSVFYAVDLVGWAGNPGDSLLGTSFINGLPDESGDFSVDVSMHPPGVYDVTFIGAYNEDGDQEQCGTQSSAITFHRYRGIDDILVQVTGHDGIPDNVNITVFGTGPDTPHGWRYSTSGPPVDESGNILTDLNNWEGSVFVEGEVAPAGTNKTITIDQAGTYTLFAMACWADGTPIVAANTHHGFVFYPRVVVRPHPYMGLTEVTLTKDGGDITITAKGDYHHWHYTVNELFTTSRNGAMIDPAEGTEVLSGETATFTPDKNGKYVIYVAAVDHRHRLVPGSPTAGVAAVHVRLFLWGDIPTIDPPSTYDPQAIVLPGGVFAQYPETIDADGKSTGPVTVTDVEFSAAIGFASVPTLTAMAAYGDFGFRSLIMLHQSVGADFFNSSSVDFNADVANGFVTTDNSIMEAMSGTLETGIGTGIMHLEEALDFPAAYVGWRLDEMYKNGDVDFQAWDQVVNGGSIQIPYQNEDTGETEIYHNVANTVRWQYHVTNPLTNPRGGAFYDPQRTAESDLRKKLADDMDSPYTSAYMYETLNMPVKTYAASGAWNDKARIAHSWSDLKLDRDLSGRGARYCPKQKIATIPVDPYFGNGPIEDVNISSTTGDRENLDISNLPFTHGPIDWHWDIGFSHAYTWASVAGSSIVHRGDVQDWDTYVCYKEWMGVDPDTLVTLPMEEQSQFIQREWDYEWNETPELPATGQRRDEWLFVVYLEAAVLGLELETSGWEPPADEVARYSGVNARHKALVKK